MPPMPYVMEIGPVFSLLDDYLEDHQHMVTLLKELRDPTIKSVASLEVFGSRSAKQLPNDPVSHIEEDWFGYRAGRTGQDPFNWNNPRPTGWWTQWYGDADAITRETLKRGLEVALGVPHNDLDGNPNPTRYWRLQCNWTCGSPFFQGWVSWLWDDDDPNEGVVTVTFTTPGNGHPLYATPYRPPSKPWAPDYEVGPPTPNGVGYGLWLIGQPHTEMRRPSRHTFDDLGQGLLPEVPGAFVYTFGDPIVVAPAEEDGGVLHAGRPW